MAGFPWLTEGPAQVWWASAHAARPEQQEPHLCENVLPHPLVDDVFGLPIGGHGQQVWGGIFGGQSCRQIDLRSLYTDTGLPLIVAEHAFMAGKKCGWSALQISINPYICTDSADRELVKAEHQALRI